MSLIYFILELNVNFLKLLFNSVKISAHFYDSTTVYYIYLCMFSTESYFQPQNLGRFQKSRKSAIKWSGVPNCQFNLQSSSPRQHVLTNVRGCFGNIKQIVHQNHIPDSNKTRWFYIYSVNITKYLVCKII